MSDPSPPRTLTEVRERARDRILEEYRRLLTVRNTDTVRKAKDQFREVFGEEPADDSALWWKWLAFYQQCVMDAAKIERP